MILLKGKLELFLFGFLMGFFIVPLVLYFGLKKWWQVFINQRDKYWLLKPEVEKGEKKKSN